MTATKKAKPRVNRVSQDSVHEDQIVAGGALATNVNESELQAKRDLLAKAIAKRDKINVWDRDKLARANAEITVMEVGLSIAELGAMPMPAPAATLKFQEREVSIATIQVTGNHRETQDEAETIRLARTLRTLGLQQRIGLRQMGDGAFELIFGSRRLAAAKSIGWEEMPAKVYPATLTAAEVEIIRTVENFGRKELSHVERAIAVARVLDSIEGMHWALSAEDPDAAAAARKLEDDITAAGGLHAYVGQQLGFPPKWVSDNAYVSQLGGDARKLLGEHRIDIGHARELAKLGDRAAADSIARDCARNEAGQGGRDVAYCRKEVVERLRSLRTVPWRLDVAFGGNVKGCTGQACATCKFNSKSDPDLFGGAIADEPAAGVCTNETCFKIKQDITAKDIDKSVDKAKRAAAKDDSFSPTETYMQQVVPIHVKPASAARKAKKELEPAGSKPQGQDEQSGYRETPEDKARQKYREATWKWNDKIREIVPGAALKDHSRILLMMVLSESMPSLSYNTDNAEIIKEGEILIQNALKNGTADLLTRIQDAEDREDWCPDFLRGSPPEWVNLVAQAWKLDIPAAPKLANFLPKPKASKTSVAPCDSPNAKSNTFKLKDRVQSSDGFETGVVTNIHKHDGAIVSYHVKWDGIAKPSGPITPDGLLAENVPSQAAIDADPARQGAKDAEASASVIKRSRKKVA